MHSLVGASLLQLVYSQGPAPPAPVPLTTASLSASGVFPSLSAFAESAPKRSECGVGAMMAWNNMLYYTTYLSVPDAGNGTGLYAIDQNLQQVTLRNHSSVFANRLLIPGMQSIVIGPYIIDALGGIRTLTQLLEVRIGGMAEHLFSPETKAYFLSMDGPFFECDLVALNCTQLFDLVEALHIPWPNGPEQVHLKAAHTMAGRVWVASNTFEQDDFLGLQHGGRLATWDGSSANWTILEETAFVEVTGRHNMGGTVFAVGWDDASVILKVLDTGLVDKSYDDAVQTYRLPKASHAYDHLWTTEWPRLREVETERFLLDMHGLFYEVPAFTWGGATWGIKPVSQHLRMVPDFASFRGFLVLGGNQVSSIFDANWVTGQAQSGMWFGKTDDLWSFGGKPQGWGGPWRYDVVAAGVPSDAYLLTGFDKKVAHFRVDPPAPNFAARRVRSAAGRAAARAVPMPRPRMGAGNVTFQVQIDFTGSAGHRGAHFYMEPWNLLASVTVTVGEDGAGYGYFVFPEGFSAHWVRFVTDATCNCTAQLTYT